MAYITGQEKMRGLREGQGVGWEISCPRKLFLDERKSRFLAEVWFPRRPHTVLPRSKALSDSSSAIT